MNRLTERDKSGRAHIRDAIGNIKRLNEAVERLAVYEDEAEKLHDSMTQSHSEAAILRGCIALMQALMGRFEEYLDFIGVHPENEEDRFETNFYMTEIVERLFLWETHHSGGTSQRMKLAALGVKAETVTFSDDRDACSAGRKEAHNDAGTREKPSRTPPRTKPLHKMRRARRLHDGRAVSVCRLRREGARAESPKLPPTP